MELSAKEKEIYDHLTKQITELGNTAGNKLKFLRHYGLCVTSLGILFTMYGFIDFGVCISQYGTAEIYTGALITALHGFLISYTSQGRIELYSTIKQMLTDNKNTFEPTVIKKDQTVDTTLEIVSTIS
jgi:hypothetical protein